MNWQSFSLKPFLSTSILPELSITGSINRHSNNFAIHYALLGALSEVVIPVPADMRMRKNALWEETCFEFFLNVKNSSHYWEFNLSPSGHWNVYRFKAYRQGMQAESAFSSLPFSVQRHQDALQVSLRFDLDRIIAAKQALNIGISAVVKLINGKVTCWALTHPCLQADFHQRDSFIIEL